MPGERSSIPKWLWAGLGALPLFVWWLGWNPGFASSDTIDQFGQLRTEVIYDHHTPLHTLYLDLLSFDGSLPGAVTLVQLLLFGVLLVFGTKWLMRAGVPSWLAIGAAWLLGLSPAVAPMTLALWKDVPFGLVILWAWIELLAIAVDGRRLDRLWPAVRMGLALAGIWLFRGNGPLTVLLVGLALMIVLRAHLRALAVTGGTLIATVFMVLVPGYALVDVQPSGVHPAEVFLADVAASLNAEPETFTQADLQLIEDVAPFHVWSDRYDCYESTPLLFDPEFSHVAVRESADEWVALELRVLLRDFDSVLAHRICASNFVYSPAQPDGVYFHRPPYEIPPNQVGLARQPLVDEAFQITDRIWRWAEVEGRLWLTWRPAIVLLPALAAMVLFAFRPAGRRFLIPSALFLAHLANIAATSPAQEFRFAYPLYLMGVLTLPLLWPVLSGQVGTMRRSKVSSLSRSGATR